MAGELELRGNQKLGAIAKETEQVQAPVKIGTGSGAGKQPVIEPPKWQRLGFKSEAAMTRAEFLANHPKEVKEVIEEAKAEDDSSQDVSMSLRIKLDADEFDL